MLDDPAHGGNSGTMPCNTGQSTPCSPAAIAVHDHRYMQSFRLITLHCKVTSQKKVQARTGARRRTRPSTGSFFLMFAASRTTSSSVDRYSTKRLRTEDLIRQMVCGRLSA